MIDMVSSFVRRMFAEEESRLLFLGFTIALFCFVGVIGGSSLAGGSRVFEGDLGVDEVIVVFE